MITATLETYYHFKFDHVFLVFSFDLDYIPDDDPKLNEEFEKDRIILNSLPDTIMPINNKFSINGEIIELKDTWNGKIKALYRDKRFDEEPVYIVEWEKPQLKIGDILFDDIIVETLSPMNKYGVVLVNNRYGIKA